MSERPRLLIRCDATAAWGLGHLKRCTALALALQDQGADVALTGHTDATAVAAAVAQRGLHWLPLPAPALQDGSGVRADAQAALAAWRGQPWPGPARAVPDGVIVDHYALDARWHRAVRDAGVGFLVVVDDLADRPLDPDLLIDHNPVGDPQAKYRKVLDREVPMCTGLRHALLDPRFAAHPKARWRDEVQDLGIFLGGSDPGGHSAWVLQVLRRDVGYAGRVHLATSTANPRWRELRDLAHQDGRCHFALDLPDLADWHAGQDLQIGAGGGAMWERCCLGVPTLALVCADNQRVTIDPAEAAGAVLGLPAMGRDAAQAAALATAVGRLLADAPARAALRQRALGLVDGLGAGRCATAVLRQWHEGTVHSGS